jgi:hypothetical protein
MTTSPRTPLWHGLAVSALIAAFSPANAQLSPATKVVVVKSAGGTDYHVDPFDTVGAISGASAGRALKQLNGETLRALGSDGDLWYSINRSGSVNCFLRYSSYQGLLGGQALQKTCTASAGDGYRGLTSDGRQFYTLYWDGTQHWWQTYGSWQELVANTPSSRVTTRRHADIYKGIAYDPATRSFLSLAQSGTTVFLLKYASYNDMLSVASASGSFNYTSNEPHVALGIGPTAPTLDVLLVAGQSNAVGWKTNGAWLPASAYDSQVRFFYRIGEGMDMLPSTPGGVTTLGLQPAAFRGNVPPTTFGIEMGAGRTLAAAGRQRLAMVKVAYGGTHLYSQWSPTNATGLFQILQANLSIASAQWAQQGWRTRVVGLLWMQGEYDANDATRAAAYPNSLKALVTSVRGVAGDSCLPMVIGRITPVWTYAATVRSAQEQFVAGDRCARLVNTDDLPAMSNDPAHFSDPSQYTLGQRMGEAFRQIGGW